MHHIIIYYIYTYEYIWHIRLQSPLYSIWRPCRHLMILLMWCLNAVTSRSLSADPSLWILLVPISSIRMHQGPKFTANNRNILKHLETNASTVVLVALPSFSNAMLRHSFRSEMLAIAIRGVAAFQLLQRDMAARSAPERHDWLNVSNVNLWKLSIDGSIRKAFGRALTLAFPSRLPEPIELLLPRACSLWAPAFGGLWGQPETQRKCQKSRRWSCCWWKLYRNLSEPCQIMSNHVKQWQDGGTICFQSHHVAPCGTAWDLNRPLSLRDALLERWPWQSCSVQCNFD